MILNTDIIKQCCNKNNKIQVNVSNPLLFLQFGLYHKIQQLFCHTKIELKHNFYFGYYTKVKRFICHNVTCYKQVLLFRIYSYFMRTVLPWTLTTNEFETKIFVCIFLCIFFFLHSQKKNPAYLRTLNLSDVLGWQYVLFHLFVNLL